MGINVYIVGGKDKLISTAHGIVVSFLCKKKAILTQSLKTKGSFKISISPTFVYNVPPFIISSHLARVCSSPALLCTASVSTLLASGLAFRTLHHLVLIWQINCSWTLTSDPWQRPLPITHCPFSQRLKHSEALSVVGPVTGMQAPPALVGSWTLHP